MPWVATSTSRVQAYRKRQRALELQDPAARAVRLQKHAEAERTRRRRTGQVTGAGRPYGVRPIIANSFAIMDSKAPLRTGDGKSWTISGLLKQKPNGLYGKTAPVQYSDGRMRRVACELRKEKQIRQLIEFWGLQKQLLRRIRAYNRKHGKRYAAGTMDDIITFLAEHDITFRTRRHLYLHRSRTKEDVEVIAGMIPCRLTTRARIISNLREENKKTSD